MARPGLESRAFRFIVRAAELLGRPLTNIPIRFIRTGPNCSLVNVTEKAPLISKRTVGPLIHV